MGIYENPNRVPDGEEIKNLHVRFSDGRIFRIPSEIVADDRAEYYSDRDDNTNYEDEYKYSIQNAFELYDWVKNNMNWEDVKDEAELVERDEANLSEEFVNADFSFVTE